jgi:hypothetical protein
MALNFPSNPSLNDRYTYASKTFIWKGSYWSPIGANPQDVYTKTNFTATSGQTTFTVAYTIGYIDVWLNGVKLTGGTDFTASNGASVVLTTGATLNDEIQVIAWNPTRLTDGTIIDLSVAGSITEQVYSWSSTTGSVTTELEPDNGTIQTLTLTGNITSLTDNFSSGQALTLHITDGGYTITWPTMTWVNNGGSAPDLSTPTLTIVSLWKVGSTLYGALVGDGS